jgi:hypothetical protein
MKTDSAPATPPCRRSFWAARDVNSVKASAKWSCSTTAWPKERVWVMACLAAAMSSSSMHGVPCNSRMVRSSTTDQRLRASAGSKRAKSSALRTPAAWSCGTILRPTPQTSCTAVAASTASRACGSKLARLQTCASVAG